MRLTGCLSQGLMIASLDLNQRYSRLTKRKDCRVNREKSLSVNSSVSISADGTTIRFSLAHAALHKCRDKTQVSEDTFIETSPASSKCSSCRKSVQVLIVTLIVCLVPKRAIHMQNANATPTPTPTPTREARLHKGRFKGVSNVPSILCENPESHNCSATECPGARPRPTRLRHQRLIGDQNIQ